MNRAFSIILFVLLIFLPLSLSLDDNIKFESIEILIKKTKDILYIFNDEPREITISEDQKVLISKKLEVFQHSNDSMVQEYEALFNNSLPELDQTQNIRFSYNFLKSFVISQFLIF